MNINSSMKRIHTFLCSLLIFILTGTGAGAQTVTEITELAGLSNNKVYNIAVNTDGKGPYYMVDRKENFLQTNYASNCRDITYSTTETAYQFAIYKSQKTGLFYFYSVNSGRFIGGKDAETNNILLVSDITTSIIIYTNGTIIEGGLKYSFCFSPDGTGILNTGGTNGMSLWGGMHPDDRGSCYRILEVDNLDAAVLTEIENKVNVFESKYGLTSLDELSNRKIYNIDVARSSATEYYYMLYKDGVDYLQTNFGGGCKDIPYSPTEEAYQFAIYKSAYSGDYYMYNIAAGKFVGGRDAKNNNRIPYVGDVTNPISIYTDGNVTKNGIKYIFCFSPNSNGMLHAGDVDYGMMLWENKTRDDAGSCYRIKEVDNELTDDQLLSIANKVNMYELLKKQFPVSSSTDSPVWCYISTYPSTKNGEKWNILVNEGSEATSKEETVSEYGIPEDKDMWCIVRDKSDGCCIYNKEVGLVQALYIDEDGNLSFGNTATVFYPIPLEKGSQVSSDAVDINLISADRKWFLGLDSSGKLSVSSAAEEENSVFTFYPFVERYVRYLEEIVAMPLKTVNGFQGVKEEAETRLADLRQNPEYWSNLKDLASWLESLPARSSNGITLEVGKYYYFWNVNRRKAIEHYIGNNTDNENNLVGQPTSGGEVSQMFRLVSDADKAYKFQYVNAPTKYLPTPGSNDGTEKLSLAEKETSNIVETVAGARFRIYGENGYLICDENDNISGRTVCNTLWAGDGAWNIVEVDTIYHQLKNINHKDYGTACFPFPVRCTTPTGVCVLHENTDRDYTVNSYHLTQKEYPANEGMFLVQFAQPDAVAKFVILDKNPQYGAEDGLLMRKNILKGTCAPFKLTEDNRYNYFVFGLGSQNKLLGFYTTSTSVKVMPANKAWIHINNGSSLANSLLLMEEDGDVTNIGDIISGTSAQEMPVYDLTGRRVLEPVKGHIYISGGKKFVAQ